MLFPGKINRAMKWAREQRMREEGLDPEKEELKEELRRLNAKHGSAESDLPTPEELKKESQEIKVTGREMGELVLTGMITIVPICLLILLAIALVAFALFGGFS